MVRHENLLWLDQIERLVVLGRSGLGNATLRCNFYAGVTGSDLSTPPWRSLGQANTRGNRPERGRCPKLPRCSIQRLMVAEIRLDIEGVAEPAPVRQSRRTA